MRSKPFAAATFVMAGTLGWQQVQCVTGQLPEYQCQCVLEGPHGVESPNPPPAPQPNLAGWTNVSGTATPHTTVVSRDFSILVETLR